MSVLEEIAAERRRQVEVEGWTAEHDDAHVRGELARAAAGYAGWAGGLRHLVKRATSACGVHAQVPRGWPWRTDWWKPKDPRRDLIRAGALIVAEIERLDRAAGHGPT